MTRRSFFLHPIILLSSFISGFIVMFNWCSRHPYLVFFESKIGVIARYGASMALFFLIFTLIRAFINYLTQEADKETRRLFFQTDLITYLVLGPILLKRYFIPHRKEGNDYYLAVFIAWVVLKIVLVVLFFDRKTLRQFPKKSWALLKKSSFVWKMVSQKNEHNLFYFLIPITYYFLLQALFARSFPLISFLAPLSYTLFFFSLLLLVHSVVRAFLPKMFYTCLIYTSFLICVLSTLDYFSFQLLSIHMNGSLGVLLSDGIRQIPEALEAADVKPLYFTLSVLLTLTLPLLGVWGYKRLPLKKVKFSLFLPLALACSSLGICYTSDHFIQKKLPVSTAQSLLTALPIYPLFLKTEGEQIHFTASLKPPPNPEEFQVALENTSYTSSTKPHIFVFVIESLRADYLSDETAPFLTSIQKEAPKFDLTASNSNVTHCSLFSIYNGLYPHHWHTVRERGDKTGSFPLQTLKKSGYKLDALHSSFFKYFNIGEVLFGKDHSLLDTLYEAKHLCGDVAIRDQMVIEKSKELVSSFKEGDAHYVTILLDSTHHHYYWPENFEPPFKPYLQSFNYTNKGKGQLELTKNRYRNSISYVDSLIQDFCDHLKAENLYDSSIIVITGDHGEEFMEHGHYFHGTDLCLPQSHVPIFYKFPKGFEKKEVQTLTSHVDIFPTLFDVLQISYPKKMLEGTSIFSEDPSFILSFRPQHKKSPYKFYLHNGVEKIEGKFLNSEEIYKSKGIELIAIKDLEEKNKVFSEPNASTKHTLSLFEQPLKELFNSN